MSSFSGITNVAEVVQRVEERLREESLRAPRVFDVVPRSEVHVFPNQIVLDSGDSEFVVTVIKVRQSRRK